MVEGYQVDYGKGLHGTNNKRYPRVGIKLLYPRSLGIKVSIKRKVNVKVVAIKTGFR